MARAGGERPSPHQIAAFTEAARLQSFSRAAEAMNVTQSSITQHVRNLEILVGSTLFIRHRQGLELTHVGRELFEISDRIRDLELLFRERFKDYGAMEKGHLKIVSHMPRPALVAVDAFMKSHAGVQVEFDLVNRSTALRLLHRREVDAAILVAPPVEDGLWTKTIGTTRFLAYVLRGHALSSRPTVSLDKIAEEIVIFPEQGSMTQRVVQERAGELGVSFPRVLKARTFGLVKEAVQQGIGVGFMPENGQADVPSLTGLAIKDLPEFYDIGVVVPADKRDLRIVSRFCDILTDVTDVSSI